MSYMEQENGFILEAERKAKQIYLREEILETGYSAEAFTQFIEERKGANIDLWSFEELHECVREFKDFMRQRKEEERKQAKRASMVAAKPVLEKEQGVPSQGQSQTSNLIINKASTNSDLSEDTKEGQDSAESEIISSKPLLTEWVTDKHESVYTLPTLKAPETELIKFGPLVATVLEPDLITKALFLQKTVIYNIHTEPAGWKVKRKYDDFVWLDDTLNNMYPTSYRPPLSGKSRKSKVEKDLLEKRQVFLSNYLNAVLRNPLFRRCSYLFSFLSEPNEQAFKNTQKQSKREKKPGSIDEFYSVTGEVTCDPNDSRDLIAKIQEYATKSEIIKYRLEKESENICNTLTSLSKSLKDFSDLIGELKNIQSTLPWVSSNQGDSSSALLDEVQRSFKTWSIAEEDLKDSFKDHVFLLYSYTKKEIRPLNSLIKETENYYSFYVKNSFKLKETKEKLWKSRDIKKWDLEESGILKETLFNDKELAFSLMCSKESAKLRELKNFYAFFNSECLREISRTLKDSYILDNLHLEKWCAKSSRQYLKLSELWESLQYNAKTVIEGFIEEQPLIQIN